MKILWLGLNPSTKNKDPQIAFVGSRSYKRLSRWQQSLVKDFNNIEHVTLNISNKVTARSEDVKTQDYLDVYSLLAVVKPDLVIGLGQKVGSKLKSLNIAHFQVPHPSPRNRWFNKNNNENFTYNAIKRVVEGEIQ